MSDPEVASNKSDIVALRAMQADAAKLERIESLLDRFNVFEAIGFVGKETMHSRFLAFLLNPQQSHGLGDLFLRRFLQKVSESTHKVSLQLAFDNANEGGLDHTTVHREVYTGDGRIDILLLNEVGQWAMIIENKVWSAEHSDQLDRYYRFVKKNHPSWQVQGLYLTPYGVAPERREDSEKYQPLSYGMICGVLDGVLEDRDSTLNSDVRVAVEHYVGMVRRNIVNDAEVSKLSREIYRKHYRAINRILVDLDATSEAIRKLVKNLIKETPKLTYGYHEAEVLKDWIVFDHQEWDVPALKVGERYHNSDRLLYFVFHSDFSESLDIWLELGPGDTATRNRLLDAARRNPSMFVETMDTAGEYLSLFKRTLLTGEPLDKLSSEEREKVIRKQWDAFVKEDLPRIEAAIKKETWIWEPVEPEDRA